MVTRSLPIDGLHLDRSLVNRTNICPCMAAFSLCCPLQPYPPLLSLSTVWGYSERQNFTGRDGQHKLSVTMRPRLTDPTAHTKRPDKSSVKND